MNKSIIIAIIAIVVIAVGAFVVVNNASQKDTNTSQSTTTEPTTTPSTDSSERSTAETEDESGTGQSNSSDAADSAEAVTITYSSTGFNPSTITVKAGSTVTVKNNADSSLQFASDPHPEHTDNTELNAGAIAPGQSKALTLNKTGTFGIHNHVMAEHKGSVTVE